MSKPHELDHPEGVRKFLIEVLTDHEYISQATGTPRKLMDHHIKNLADDIAPKLWDEIAKYL